jgi:hypothetical protein
VKITQTIERECCEPGDLKPIPGSPKRGRDPEYVACKYCARVHKMRVFTDAAGATDWEYVPDRLPWEPSPEELARRIEHAIAP